MPSRLTRLRPLLFLPPVLVAVALLLWAVSSRAPPATVSPAETATTVRVLSVEPRNFTPRVSGFGVVEPARTRTATAQVAGRIEALGDGFLRGGRVEAGQVVARIEDADYRIVVAQAEAQVAALDARLAELDLGLANARESLAIERETLVLAERELERQRDLVERGTAPAAALEAEERQTLAQRARVQELENQIALHPSQRRALEQERAAAEAALARARLDVGRTVIRAPFEARVASVAVERDQFVGVGGEIGRLDGVERAEIDLQVPQSRMRDFVRFVYGRSAAYDPDLLADPAMAERLQADVRLRFKDETVTWPARVSRPSAALDPEARAFGVILTVDDPFEPDPAEGRPPLFRGLFVEADLLAGPAEGVILVPREAIRGGAVLIVDAEDRLRRREVEVAMTADGAAVVSGGLAPGDRVVLTDLPAAVEGMALSPVEDERAAARLAGAAGP